MSGNNREWRRAARALAAAAPLVGGLALAGCSAGNTYGTGTSPGIQTLKDISGIAIITGAKKDPIDYEPRPNLVVPPSTADLPPPQPDPGTAAATAANWPKDPDAASAKAKADAAAAAASGQIPNQYYVASTSPHNGDSTGNGDKDLTPAQVAALRKQFAAAHGAMSVDDAGNPVRKYLTDPPVDYRQPDPTQPLTADATTQKKRKKFLWWYVDE